MQSALLGASKNDGNDGDEDDLRRSSIMSLTGRSNRNDIQTWNLNSRVLVHFGASLMRRCNGGEERKAEG